MLELGSALECGVGVEKDKAQALDWYEMSAKRGNTYAMSRLSSYYLYEKEDPSRALYFARLGAQAGDVDLMVTVANMQMRGYAADQSEARYWAVRAAKAGDGRGHLALAKLLARGVGGPADDALAAEHYRAGLRLEELGFAKQQFIELLSRRPDLRQPGDPSLND